MLHLLLIWLPVLAFLGAGVVNAIGSPATRNSFVRWGFPWWWCRVTGVLEMLVAALIAIPATHQIGLILGAVVIAAAAVTVLRHREYSHLAPIGGFVRLLVVGVLAS